MPILQKPGEYPTAPGVFVETGPRGGQVRNPRMVVILPHELITARLPATRRPRLRWEWNPLR